MVNVQRLIHLSPIRIAGSYVVFGVVWILVSDQVVASVVASPAALTTIQTIKGWTFVAISGLLILSLTNLHHRQLTDSQSRLETAHQQLQVLNRVFRHNIRNDVTVIRGHIDLTREHVSDTQVREFMEIANGAVERILSISEKFSLVGKVDPQPEKDAYADLVRLVQRAGERIEAKHPGVTIELTVPDSAWVLGDRSLGYAVQEVFENAIEHGDKPPEDCRIDVSIETTWSEVVLRVTDDGPGISQGELDALRKGEETPLVHSSGIGLWLVQWICEYHGGSVEYESPSDGGTEAILRFELAPHRTLVDGFVPSESMKSISV